MSRTDRIEAALHAVFQPSRLEVADESERHRGHAGYQEGGESHFHVVIRSPRFEGLSRIARHRAVHDALGRDLMGEIHALSLDLGT
ncbi:BolA family protein [Litorisediminicola beolgyonensis]|uniref:BolA family protein n=1 Tax=Litorisediminicola beolgyonensis TaxID=1173614 RepID=A0ABW3ZGS3_9RHOB